MKHRLKITLWIVSGVLLAIFILVNIVGYQKGKEMVTFPMEMRESLTQTPADFGMPVITSYSIHYTKLYEHIIAILYG